MRKRRVELVLHAALKRCLSTRAASPNPSAAWGECRNAHACGKSLVDRSASTAAFSSWIACIAITNHDAASQYHAGDSAKHSSNARPATTSNLYARSRRCLNRMRPRRLTGLWLCRCLRHCDRLSLDLIAHAGPLSLDRGWLRFRSRLVLHDTLRLRNLARRGRSRPLDRRDDLTAFRRRRREREPIRRGRKVQILLEVVAHRFLLPAARRDHKSGGAYQYKLTFCAHRSSFPLHDRNAGRTDVRSGYRC